MKHIMMIFSVLILSTFAHAAPKHVALCEMEIAEEELQAPDLVNISSVNVQDMKSLSPSKTNLLNRYLINQQYTTKDLSLEEIKLMFSEGGEYPYDELHLSSYQAKSTGTVYNQVHSYPGDNQYGLIFDINGNLVASINDGSISLFENNQTINCYELVK